MNVREEPSYIHTGDAVVLETSFSLSLSLSLSLCVCVIWAHMDLVFPLLSVGRGECYMLQLPSVTSNAILKLNKVLTHSLTHSANVSHVDVYSCCWQLPCWYYQSAGGCWVFLSSYCKILTTLLSIFKECCHLVTELGIIHFVPQLLASNCCLRNHIWSWLSSHCRRYNHLPVHFSICLVFKMKMRRTSLV